MEVLCSPVNGKATMLENVHDEMFSEKMLGDGIAVIPDENELRSPVEGTVTMIYETQHAIGIQTLILGLACIYRLVTSLLLIVLAMHLTPTGLQFSSKLVNLILRFQYSATPFPGCDTRYR